MLTLSTVLAVLLAALSFAHFYIARDVFHVGPYELHSIMYLHISSGKFTVAKYNYNIENNYWLTYVKYLAPHFVIFSTRVPGYWWKNIPHWIFTVCILGTQVLAFFFSVYGVFGEREKVAPCGYPWGLAVLGVSLVYFMFLDVVKVFFFRRWNFELTAKLSPTPKRRLKLQDRVKEAEQRGRLETAWQSISEPVEANQIVAAFKNANKA